MAGGARFPQRLPGPASDNPVSSKPLARRTLRVRVWAGVRRRGEVNLGHKEIPMPQLRQRVLEEFERRNYSQATARAYPGFLIIICQPSQGGEGKRHITSGIGDGEVVEVGKQSVVRPCRPRLISNPSLAWQRGEGKRQITSGIGDGEVVEVGKQSVVRPCRPRSVGILSLLRQGGEGKRHITSWIGDGEVVEVGKQSVVRPCRPRSVGILSLLRQAS